MNVILESVDYNPARIKTFEYKFVLENINNNSEFIILTDEIFNVDYKNKVIPIDDFFKFYKKYL